MEVVVAAARATATAKTTWLEERFVEEKSILLLFLQLLSITKIPPQMSKFKFKSTRLNCSEWAPILIHLSGKYLYSPSPIALISEVIAHNQNEPKAKDRNSRTHSMSAFMQCCNEADESCYY
eukprot:scaffold774_cov80-Skeletonema_dohrnii-CCMP3373.AAC.1